MVAAQLLDVAHVVGIQQHLRTVRAARDVATFAASAFERHRLAEVLLGLDVILQQLQMQRAQEARGLAQDRDDARVGLQLRDASGGGADQR